MIGYVVIFFAALLLTMGGTPVVRVVALRTGVIDQPAARKLHSRPVPLLGGVAIYLGVTLALILFTERFYVAQMFAILLGATWIGLFGFLDDRMGLGAGVKLGAQLVGALILILVGVQVDLAILPEWLNLLLTVLWVVGITNALNLLDNMDGLSSGVGAVASVFFLLLAVLGGQYLVGAMAAAVLGACLGFLIYNFNPASIFMGDTGSLFIGFVLAALGIKLRFPANVPWVTWMIPLLVLAVPLFDTTLVFVSRLRRGLNPLTTPGRDHISHRLTDRGWSRREAVLLLYLAGCIGGAVAVFVSVADVVSAYTVVAAVLLAVTALLARYEF